MTVKTPGAILTCPKCGQKNRVMPGREGPVCGRCRAALPELREAAGAAKPVEVTDASYPAEVLGSPVPVLLDCWAAWCGPCRAVAPSIERLATAYAGRAKICKLDVDRNPRTAAALGVQGIPAMFFIAQGRVVDQLVGAHPYASIQAKLDEIVSRASRNGGA